MSGQLPQPKLWPWLHRALLDWAVIVLCFTLIYHVRVWPVWVVCFVLIAARQHALAILGHDGAHRLACRNRLLNDAVTGLFCFWPLGFAIKGYRRFHFEHHRTVGTPEDPELIHKNNRWFGQWRLPLLPWKLTLQMVTDLLGGAVPHLGFAAYLTRPANFLDRLGPVVFITSTVLVCWWLEALWIPLVWFGSILTVFWLIFRLRIWSEHVGTNGTHILRANWWQRLLLLPHNTWCHWEHHEQPSIPCWALPAFRTHSASELTLGYLFRQLASCTEGDLADRRPSQRQTDAVGAPRSGEDWIPRTLISRPLESGQPRSASLARTRDMQIQAARAQAWNGAQAGWGSRPAQTEEGQDGTAKPTNDAPQRSKRLTLSPSD